jgi:hypothetical protein
MCQHTTSGKGTLHAHFLLWLIGQLEIETPANRAALAARIDQMTDNDLFLEVCVLYLLLIVACF